jgi:hypothetical protein
MVAVLVMLSNMTLQQTIALPRFARVGARS